MEETKEETKQSNDIQETSAEGILVYELGFHIVPLVTESELSEKITGLHTAIEKVGGSIIGEAQPESIDLAYPMQTEMDRNRHMFDRAYFGWIKFEGEASAIETLHEELEKDEHILRFLITKSVRELLPFRPVEMEKANLDTKEKEVPAPEKKVSQEAVVEKPKDEKMDKKAVDAEIEKLVVE